MQSGDEVAIKMTWPILCFLGNIKFEVCDVVVTSATLVYAQMDIILCDMGSTYLYVSVQLPWGFDVV